MFVSTRDCHIRYTWASLEPGFEASYTWASISHNVEFVYLWLCLLCARTWWATVVSLIVLLPYDCMCAITYLLCLLHSNSTETG